MKKIFKDYASLLIIILLASILRLWGLDLVPVSLFADEVDVGYQALSLSQTARDYMGNLLPAQVESLADKKPALYSYTLIPTIMAFGISPYGVRLPAAIFGILNVFLIYLIAQVFFKNKTISLISALLLAISPWHIQYSRFGFEGTEMLSLYLGGLYFFLKGLINHKWLILSTTFFGLTLWSYHSAKIFIPLTLITLIVIWRKELLDIPKKYLLISVLALILVSIPVCLNVIFEGGAQRFGSTSVFADETIIGEIGSKRLQDQQISHEKSPSIPDRFFHNKMISYIAKLTNNYLQTYSTEFLFIKGDPIMRHSLPNYGEFYKVEVFFLIAGMVFLLTKNIDKNKILIFLWLLFAPIPSVITSDGGTHASRLLFMLIPLILLIASGVYYIWKILPFKFRRYYILVIIIIFFLSFLFYLHNYWNHYPLDSEKWWQAGYEDAIKSTIDKYDQYNKIIISNADEPSLLFFLGFSKFPPSSFQKNYPLTKELISGFGEVGKLAKYYFPPQGNGVNLYELGKILPENSLYIATQKEINLNLLSEPERIPNDIRLIKAVTYPSGKPAFYLFDKK